MARITQSALVEALACDCDLPQSTVRRVLNRALDQILLAVADGHQVQLHGFGTFAPRDRAARTGRNLRTGEPIAIPASRAMGFKPSRAGK